MVLERIFCSFPKEGEKCCDLEGGPLKRPLWWELSGPGGGELGQPAREAGTQGGVRTDAEKLKEAT